MVDLVLWETVERWAADNLRSVNAQVEFILRRALSDAGRLNPAPSREETDPE
ncbi:hypothetical protein [Paraeggerthella sp.]|jgi:hypothetical protein|uniref:hypothetical protein n=1 Tax=Paraeggerthella sp. TaxID=2897350 RepID=UPI0015F020C4